MNSLVAYGSDSEESENGGDEKQHQQRRQYNAQEQQLSEAETSSRGEPAAADLLRPELFDSAPGCELPPHLQQQQQQLVEPRAPRRQSDLYEDDYEEEGVAAAEDSDTDMEEEEGVHDHAGDRDEEEEDEAERGEREEEELLLMSASKFLTADQQLHLPQPSSGACTPAGYTPRANQQEDELGGGGPISEDIPMEEDQSRGQVQVPPSPPGQCSPTLQRKFDRFFERKAAGWDPNAMIKARRDFKNPSLYETLVGLYEINEKGTNFDPQVYDPSAFQREDFYDELGDRQAALEAKRKQQKQLGTSAAGSAAETRTVSASSAVLSPAAAKAGGASRRPALPPDSKQHSSSSSSKKPQQKASSSAGARRSRLDK